MAGSTGGRSPGPLPPGMSPLETQNRKELFLKHGALPWGTQEKKGLSRLGKILSITSDCHQAEKQAAPVPRQFKRFWSATFPWCFVLPAACALWVQVGSMDFAIYKKT